MLALSLAITLAYPDAARDASADLVALVANLPGVLVRALVGAVQLLALLTPVVLVAIAVRWKRPLQVTVAVAAGAIAGLGAALGQHWLDDATPAASVDALTIDSFVTGAAFPSGSYLAGLAAAVTVLSPSFSRSWRQASWAFIGVLCFVRVLTAVAVPLGLVTTIAFGVVVGSLALVALGSPARRFDLSSIAPALRTAGLEVGDLVLDDDPAGLTHRLRGTRRWRGRDGVGGRTRRAGRRAAHARLADDPGEGDRRQPTRLVARTPGRARGARLASGRGRRGPDTNGRRHRGDRAR